MLESTLIIFIFFFFKIIMSNLNHVLFYCILNIDVYKTLVLSIGAHTVNSVSLIFYLKFSKFIMTNETYHILKFTLYLVLLFYYIVPIFEDSYNGSRSVT